MKNTILLMCCVQGADVFIATGVRQPSTAAAIAAAVAAAKVPTCLTFDSADELNQTAKLGAYRPAAFAGMPQRLSLFRSALRGGSSQDRAINDLCQIFYERCTAEDLTFMVISLVNAYVTPVRLLCVCMSYHICEGFIAHCNAFGTLVCCRQRPLTVVCACNYRCYMCCSSGDRLIALSNNGGLILRPRAATALATDGGVAFASALQQCHHFSHSRIVSPLCDKIQVPAATGLGKRTGPRMLGCILTKCRKQLFTCIGDKTCKACLDCLDACKPNDQVGARSKCYHSSTSCVE